MKAFSRQDIEVLLDDLRIYSGNVREVSDLHGPHEDGSFGGVLHTCMDAFNFSASPIFQDDDSWTIHLPDGVESIIRGHRHVAILRFPRLAGAPELKRRYHIANHIYDAYNNCSGMNESRRLREYETALGYDGLPTHGAVLEAIIRDFRSYKQTDMRKLVRASNMN